MKFLAVRNFEQFQHYSKRNPPWIKLYATVLTDVAFLQLAEAAQAQLMKLWVLASQFGHPLPNNPRLLAGKIGATGRFYLADIIAAGFLIPCDENASKIASSGASKTIADPLAKDDPFPPADARSRESAELEIELEHQSISPASAEAEAGLAVLLPTDADRVALTAVLATSRSREGCLATLRGMLEGLGVARTPSRAQLGQALRDFAGNGAEWNVSHFRGYVERAMTPPRDQDPPRPTGSSRRGPVGVNPGAQQVANILGRVHRD